ncbi:MAG TPA: IPT/TIG domain-containing protein [bacterium]|nr:IPT/TIG domain-containing protein [bacterium]HQG46828.1 IPT/TIG domain-containing protein [bacterium]HQI49352.1 IPT/TIG domain-containing protein [bacterium]HQJ63716.1 IPT/TIG domain-containing protein [bacterium]
MKKIRCRLLGAAFLIAGLANLACEGPDQPVYGPNHPDPNPTGLAAATVESISPDTGYLRDIVTIRGSGFNEKPEFNLVLFGNKKAEVISVSPTELKVIAPNKSDETVNVRVAIKGSEFWSNEAEFTFLPTITTLDEEISWPNGVAVDEMGNVYVGSANDGVIYRITPEGEKTTFAEVPVSGSIHFGPNKYLYVCVKGEGKIVRISPDGGTVEDVVTVDAPVDFTWDKNHNFYVMSDVAGVYKIVGSDTVRVATIGSGKNVRVFNDHLYVNDIWNSTILSFPITAEGLGEEEVVIETDSPSTLEFDAEGTLYYAQAWETSLYTLRADGSEEVLYEGELMTPMRYSAFKGKYIYLVYPGWADIGAVMRVYIGIDAAPDYGIMP